MKAKKVRFKQKNEWHFDYVPKFFMENLDIYFYKIFAVMEVQ